MAEPALTKITAKDAWWLAFVVLIAFGLRLGFSLRQGIDDVPSPPSDQYEYTRYAWNLAHGNGYRGPEPGSQDDVRASYLPPGVPAIYASLYLVFGESAAIIRVAQGLIGAASVALVFILALRLFDRFTAWTAAGLFTIWPSALFYAHELLTETWYVFATLLFAIVCIFYLAPQPSWKRAGAAGIMFGLTTLIRPTLLFFLPFLLVWSAIVIRPLRAAAVSVIFIIVGAAIIIAPWSIRNYGVYDQFVLVTPVQWTVLLQGNNRIVATEPRYAGYSVWYTEVPEYKNEFEGLRQIEREPVAKALLLDWLNKNRDKWWYLVRSKFVRFWSPLLKQDSRLVRVTMLLSWGPILLLFIPAFFVTLWWGLRHREPMLWLHLFIGSVLLQCLIYFGLPRFRYPMEPFCIMLAASTVVFVAGGLRKTLWTSRPNLNHFDHSRQSA